MSEDEKKDQLNKQAKNKDDSNLVVDENKQIRDIYDIIEEYKSSSKTSTVGKINKLTEFGGSIEQVVEKYNEISGGDVSNIDQALEDLERAYRIIAKSISDAPNGYVIDLETGELNHKESREQAIRYGIDLDEHQIDNRNNIEDMFISEEKSFDIIANNEYVNDIITYDDIELPESIKKESEKAKEEILKDDPIEMKFAIIFDEIQKHPERSRKELDDFIEQFPEYKEKFADIIANGVNPIRLELYEYNLLKNSVSSIISRVNKFVENDELDTLDDEAKKNILRRVVALLNGNTSQEFVDEMEKCIKTLYPEISSISDIKTVGEILGIPEDEVLVYGQKLLSYFAKNDVDIAIEAKKKRESVLEQFNDSEIDVDFEKIRDREAETYISQNKEDLNVEDIDKTSHQLYFKNSKIAFTESDERNLRASSALFKAMSWIEEKDKLFEYEYLSLINQKERLQERLSKSSNIIMKKELKDTEKELEEFEKKNVSFEKDKYFENGMLKPEYKKQIKSYEKAKIKGDILSNYMEDENKIKTFEDYNNLSPKAKSKYLRDTLFGLTDNRLNQKFAMRRLEIISRKGKEFITFDDENKPKLNQVLFMKECMDYDVVSRENSDILYNRDTVARETTRFARGKLQSYEELDDSFFEKIEWDAKGSILQRYEFRARQIDKIKLKNKLRISEENLNKIFQQEPEKIEEEKVDQRKLTQDEIDQLIEKMNKYKELPIEEKFKISFSKNGKDFDNSMYDLIYENPSAAQEFLKQSLENDETKSIPNFQTKIMFLQTSIKQVEREKLKNAFDRDGQEFRDEIEELVKLSPTVAQDFLKEFVNTSQNSGINKFNEKVMILQEKITQTLDEREMFSKEKSNTFLTAEEIDISSLSREVGVSFMPDSQKHKLQEDDEPSL